MQEQQLKQNDTNNTRSFKRTFRVKRGTFHWQKCYSSVEGQAGEGVSLLSTSFFTGWGLWNLYYYPSLGQMLSFEGGVAIVLTNIIWLSLMFKYRTISQAPIPTEVVDKTD